jgi:hypothetical protein
MTGRRLGSDALAEALGGQMSNDKHETMSFREGVDRMVDRATLAIGLDPDTAKAIQAVMRCCSCGSR